MATLELDHERFMKRAILMARRNPENPFGALLVDQKSGEIVQEAVNNVPASPTFHGEVAVINQCAANHPFGAPWERLALYSTAEPCPMCQAAIVWAGIPLVIYGTANSTLKANGWRQIDMPPGEVMNKASFYTGRMIGGILEEECDKLFRRAPGE